jgi:probable HAF family extracellular repeat protein
MNALTYRIAAASLLICAGSAQALEYRLTDLGQLTAEFSSSAHGINEQGEVVGAGMRTVGDRPQAMLYRHGRLIQVARRAHVPEVSQGFATAINNSGVLTGALQFKFEQQGTPFIDDHGTLTLLTKGPDSEGEADAINNAGDVVGRTRALAGGCLCGFVYRQGHWTSLQGQGGQTLASAGLGINDGRLVAGWTEVWVNGSAPRRAAIWQAGVLIGEPGLGGSTSEARAVSADGAVVGFATTPDGVTHAFRFQNGQTVDLNSAGFLSSLALGINPSGTQVVGAGSTQGLKHAGGIVVVNGNMHLLDRHLDPVQRALWHVEAAWSVNDAGQIAAVATLQQGQQHAVLLTPVTASSPK